MWMAAAPAFSYSRTVRTTLSAFPYPVSPSAIRGMLTAAASARTLLSISVIVSSPRSGRPVVLAAVQYPLM
jgi:hypothetical protein